MVLITTRSKGLLNIYLIFLFIVTALTKTALTYSEDPTTSDPLKSAASERIGNILNVPVTLNFDDGPLTRRGRGFFGGHKRNDDVEEEKIDDGQFGARIILGIIEHPNRTTTTAAEPDQKRSQTIVKFFEKEDYDGIKNPIIVEDHPEEADQIERTRSRKETEQESAPLINDEEQNDDYSDIYEETDKSQKLEEPKDVSEREEKVEENKDNDNEKLNEDYEDNSERQQVEKSNDSEKYTSEQDDEKKIPPNHKETYTEIEYPDYDNIHDEKPSEKLKEYHELTSETEEEEPTNKNIYNHSGNLKEYHQSTPETEEEPTHQNIYHHKDAAKDSDVKQNISHKNEKTGDASSHSHKDQKGSGDNSHEEVKKKKKGGKHASGKGKEQHEEHHGSKGDKGVKNYKGYHEEVKKAKGHQDEVNHGKKYTDKGGEEKKHHEEHGHHGQYHKGEKGEKGSDFSEEGKHSKGHSTKGEHNIHKKDEYEKKQEFYDEHHEGGEHEKHGGFHHEDKYEKGGHKKVGHHKKGDHTDRYGKKSHHKEGHFYDDKNGKKKSTGHNQHHSHHAKHGKKVGNSGKKHWGYKKETGHGKHKKQKEGQQAAHSNLQQVRRIPTSVHGHYKEEGNKYPHYIGRIHVREDNRRSDTMEDKDETGSHQKVIEENGRRDIVGTEQKKDDKNKDNSEEQTDESIPHRKVIDIHEDRKSFTKEHKNVDRDKEHTEEQTEQPPFKQSKQSRFNSNDDIEDYVPEPSILLEKNKETPKNITKPLPKIYVILPKDFEDQLQRSAESSEPFSIENESSYEDSEEEKTEPKVRTIHKKYTRVIEPVDAQTFPEEHKKRLSEIEYVVHKIGADLEKDFKVKNSKSKVKNKLQADKRTSDKSISNENSEEY